MRREWSGWIKTRQWSQFEALAKTEPCQDLADTIAELELGFPDKPDRRALRKVLFLLSQAGFAPTEIEVEPPGGRRPSSPISVAFMMGPDGAGDTVLTYGREEKGRVGWLTAHLTWREGITRAIEDTTTVDEAQPRLLRLRALSPEPLLSVEVPVDYALERLAQTVARTKSLPPVMAYWRALLPKQFNSRHPAEDLPRLPGVVDLAAALRDIEPMSQWRLELGAVSPMLTEDFLKQAERSGSKELKEVEWWRAALSAERDRLFTNEVLEDHRNRLLDLAYIMNLRSDIDAGKVLRLADNLVADGAHSAYAEWMATRTFVVLVDLLKTGAAERSRGRAGA